MLTEVIAFNPLPAAQTLLTARTTGTPLAELPVAARPRTEAEAALIQDAVAKALGPVAGWKVGAATPQATPFRGPIHGETLFVGADHVPASMFRFIGVEAEIVYRIGRDLPTDRTPLTRDEVLAAIASVHPAVEIADTRFSEWNGQPPLVHRADQASHGALIVGAPLTDWRRIDPVNQRVRLDIDGETVSDVIGGNSAGDPLRLLVWLANVGARPLGGLKAGQYVTTGSCSGTVMVKAPVRIVADFPAMGRLELAIR